MKHTIHRCFYSARSMPAFAAIALALLLSVTVASAQNAPTADAGPPQNVTVGDTVTLDGSGSTNSAGNDAGLTYAWTQFGGDSVLPITLSDADTVSPTFTAPGVDTETTFEFQLIVTDGTTDSAPDTVVITVSPNPIANAGTDQNVTMGDTVTLDGSGSTNSVGTDTGLTYAWTQLSLASSFNIPLSGADTVSPTFTAPAPAFDTETDFVFQLIVTEGATDSDPDMVVITVNPNQAPTAVITDPIRTVDGGVTVTLDGSGSSDPEGGTLTYTWSQIGLPSGVQGLGLIGADSVSVSFTTPAQTAAQQQFSIQLIVTDDASPALPSSPTTAIITVEPLPPNSPPIANAGEDQTVELGDAFTLDGSGSSDPDGDTLTYLWTQTSGTDVLPDGGFTSSEVSPTVPLTNLAAGGVLVFSLAVVEPVGPETGRTPQDPSGGSDTDTVTITIVADPTVDTQKTVETINRFLETRNRLILANQPDVGRRINRLQRGVGAEQLSFATGEITKLKPFEFNLRSLVSGTYQFSTSLDQVTRAAAHDERQPFDVWFEASFHKFNGSAGADGDFGIAYLGIDHLLSPDVLVGAVLQYDSLTDRNSSDNSRTEGKGWMAGPYVTARLQENLYLDARVAVGESDNEVTPVGTYTDSFESTRWLADISLTQEFTSGDWSIRPNASLSYLEDKQKTYTNTLGGLIPSQTVSQGQFKFGPTVSRQFLGANGWRYEPSFTLDAVYSHASTRGATLSTAGFENGWRARVAPGISMTAPKGFRLSLTGNYDGIGQSGFEAWGVGVNLDMKF